MPLRVAVTLGVRLLGGVKLGVLLLEKVMLGEVVSDAVGLDVRVLVAVGLAVRLLVAVKEAVGVREGGRWHTEKLSMASANCTPVALDVTSNCRRCMPDTLMMDSKCSQPVWPGPVAKSIAAVRLATTVVRAAVAFAALPVSTTSTTMALLSRSAAGPSADESTSTSTLKTEPAMASMSRCTLARPPLPGSRYANEAPESGVMGLPPPSELTLLRMVSAPAGSATKSLGELKALSPLGVPLSKPSVMQRRGVAETVAVLVTVWAAVRELVGSDVELREGEAVAVREGVADELPELVAEREGELDWVPELVPVGSELPV